MLALLWSNYQSNFKIFNNKILCVLNFYLFIVYLLFITHFARFYSLSCNKQ